ncbi:hypothetical protein O181_087895 [Austropuccinia psidii MF-1]|uniref:Uncharacterized protein n=1 Tax=Austropuccinia psidii MF-1 TaxID=1389203 RepID=A0A9Q3P2T6_9BASI|nr:hypothetical protein [Austropuccinia psidii MF-1]
MHARKIQKYYAIVRSPKDPHVINGGCAEKILSPNLKLPDPCKKGPHQKQINMMESRGIEVEKDSSHADLPGLPKGINRAALSPKISKSPIQILSPSNYKHRNKSSLTWEVFQYIIVNLLAQ